MPLFWNLSLNSDTVFWPQIRSGFVAEKTDTFDCCFVLCFPFHILLCRIQLVIHVGCLHSTVWWLHTNWAYWWLLNFVASLKYV